ncbi:hypothetical protein VNI00_013612 [Paramarasmius palmivorus]|uniref:FAD/NAD(P)-binding domain-containing protein n=1 Tax=Paramarasmius palmivorus TaxID=297713 RepID=A0AAW0BWK7_9AGAR
MLAQKVDDKTNILVVGGGIAGISIAKYFSSLDPAKFDIVLVNPRPYCIFLIPALRMVVSDQDRLEDKIILPYDKLFIRGNGKSVEGTVVKINQTPGERHGEVLLHDGETLGYDVLVLATGGRWEGPLDFPNDHKEVLPYISQRRTEFAESQSILLVGGGPVGIGTLPHVLLRVSLLIMNLVELAGEIKDIWPDKEITVLHRRQLLLNDTYPEKFRKAIQEQVEGRGIKVIVDDSVDNVTPGVSGAPITTLKGKRLQPDLIVCAILFKRPIPLMSQQIRTWGPKPCTEFIASSLGSGTLTPKGLVRVQPTLQLVDYPNIFAAGDIIDWKEQKQGYKVMGHIAVIMNNVLSYISGKPATKEYKGIMEMLLVANGKNGGMLFMDTLWGIVIGPRIVSWLNPKTASVSRFRREMGY